MISPLYLSQPTCIIIHENLFKMNYYKSHRFKILFTAVYSLQLTAAYRSIEQFIAVYSSLQFSVNLKNPQKILYSIQGVLENYRAKKEKEPCYIFDLKNALFGENQQILF